MKSTSRLAVNQTGKPHKRNSLLLLVLLIVAVVAVSFSSPSASAIIGTCPPTPTIGDSTQRVLAFGQWNQARALMNIGNSGSQVPLVSENLTYSTASQTHALYVYANSDSSSVDPDPRTEDFSNACYTITGADGGTNGITRPGQPWLGVSNGVSTGDQAINALFSSVYDRLAMMNPRLVQVGFGITNTGTTDAKFVVDVKRGFAASPPVYSPLVWPARTQQFVPTTMSAGEFPNPLAALSLTYPVGYPVTVLFDPGASVTITSATITPNGGSALSVSQINPNDAKYTTAGVPANARNALTLIPNSVLVVNTTYTVNVTGTGFTSPISYSFTTGASASGGTSTTTTATAGSGTVVGTVNPPLLIPTQTPLELPTATPGIPAYPTPPPIISAPVGAISFERIPADATNGGFYDQWRRADDPVFFGRASRSWTFGDQPYGFSILLEPYQGQLRLVNYHDKARMEASNATSSNITNGLLVREMISGNAQVGDNAYIPRPPAYNVAVAGDVAETNINAPTYYSFYNIASLNNDHRMPVQTGQTVIATVAKDGTINVNPGTAVYGVQNVYFDNNLGHNIPNVFWDFMNRSGVINLGGIYTSGQVSDWLSTFGLPITDAYWSRIIVGGQEKDVLIQLFERRVLTFTPSNPDPFKVEMGNVGRHYFKWRYGINY